MSGLTMPLSKSRLISRQAKTPSKSRLIRTKNISDVLAVTVRPYPELDAFERVVQITRCPFASQVLISTTGNPGTWPGSW